LHIEIATTLSRSHAATAIEAARDGVLGTASFGSTNGSNPITFYLRVTVPFFS
jgi:hypothetical protein